MDREKAKKKRERFLDRVDAITYNEDNCYFAFCMLHKEDTKNTKGKSQSTTPCHAHGKTKYEKMNEQKQNSWKRASLHMRSGILSLPD